ncbi:MAG: arylamine N-acetyltransferase [Phenylobacterium sp.]
MDLQAYLDRIGFQGVARPNLATLTALHRAHLLSIPYENMDVQLGRPVTTSPDEAFDKIVTRRRGGWCYEMNGVLGAALDEIGFKVTRLAGGVHRKLRGEEMVGNHLILLVDLDGEPWIADVGFGDSSRDPFPLREGSFSAAGYDFRLEKLDADWWRMHNHALGAAANFDFGLAPADPAHLAAKCHELQTSPQSNFVLNAVCQRHTPDAIRLLRGRTLRRVRPGETEDHLIASADEFVAVLARDFDLDLPEAAALWPRICARHEELFAPTAA